MNIYDINKIQLPNGDICNLRDNQATLYKNIDFSNIIHIDNAAKKAVKNLKIQIRPVQVGNGDPSLNNVRPITGQMGASIIISPTQSAQDGMNYLIPWQNEAGTIYGGILDVVNGKLTVTHGCYAFTGNENGWNTYSNNGLNNRYSITAANIPVTFDPTTNAYNDGSIASHGTFIQSILAPTLNVGMFIGHSGYYQFIDPYASYWGSLQNFLDWLRAQNAAGTPVQIYRRLATPVIYHLTPTKITTLFGINNIWSDIGNTSCTYYLNSDLNTELENYVQKSIGTNSGDLIYYSDNSIPKRLPIGNKGEVLKVNSEGLPSWQIDNNTGITELIPGNGLINGTSGANQSAITTTGTISIRQGGVTNTMLAGSITNEKLVNSSFNIGQTTINLGDTITLSDLGIEGNYKQKQIAIIDPLADRTSSTFISTITQDSDGVITPTKANLPTASISNAGIVQLNSATNSTSTSTAATSSAVKVAYDLAASKTSNTGTVTSVTLTAGTGISISDNNVAITTNGGRTITNTGVTSISTGSTNGSLNVTTNGNTSAIAVKGLGSAAYTNTSAYATAAQGAKADAAMPKSGGTFTGPVTLNADPTSNFMAATKQYVDNNVTITDNISSGTKIATITISGTSTDLYSPGTPQTISVTQASSTPTLEFITSTNVSSSSSLTGVTSTSLADGKMIVYRLAYALPGDAVTLTLFNTSGVSLGNYPIYIDGSTQLSDIYSAGTMLFLVFYDNKYTVVNPFGLAR